MQAASRRSAYRTFARAPTARRRPPPLGDGRPLHLIFDADDTLWDSNIHFLKAEAHFVAELLEACVGAMEAVNAALRQRELEIIKSHGYGREPFVS